MSVRIERSTTNPVEITFDENNVKIIEKWFKDQNFNIYHRLDGPSYIHYYENGNLQHESWYQNGKLHREDEPSFSIYYKNGNIKQQMWYQNGKCHREDGPAYISYYKNGNIKNTRWIQNGQFHCIDDPAFIEYDENGVKTLEKWYIRDKLSDKKLFSLHCKVAKLCESMSITAF